MHIVQASRARGKDNTATVYIGLFESGSKMPHRGIVLPPVTLFAAFRYCIATTPNIFWIPPWWWWKCWSPALRPCSLHIAHCDRRCILASAASVNDSPLLPQAPWPLTRVLWILHPFGTSRFKKQRKLFCQPCATLRLASQIMRHNSTRVSHGKKRDECHLCLLKLVSRRVLLPLMMVLQVPITNNGSNNIANRYCRVDHCPIQIKSIGEYPKWNTGWIHCEVRATM